MKKHTFDIVIFFIIVALSVFVHMGRVGFSIDGVMLTTDAENYAGMAAAMAHPDIFAKDFAYSNAEEYAVHATVMTHVVSLLAHGENYGLAYVSLTGVQFFLHTLFFYILGVALLKQRWQAVFFTLIMGQIYWMPWGTYWGNGLVDYVPRSTFATLYALFVAAAFYIAKKPKWWPFFMFGMGCMVYIHSISALPAAMGFWLGFLMSKQQEKKLWPHFMWTVACGFCFLLPMIPFALNFLRAGVELSASDVSFLQEVLRVRYNLEFTHYYDGLLRFFISPFGLLLLPIAILGSLFMHRYGTQEEKDRAKLLRYWAWGAGICGALYFIDQEVARAFHRHPLEFDLIRALRFWIFFAMCLAFIFFNSLWAYVSLHKKKLRPAIAFLWCGLWVGLFLGGQNDIVRESALWFWNKADTTRYESAYAKELARKDMLEAIQKHTEKDALIFDAAGDRAIRYKALRALAYSWKDPSIYYYAKNVPKLREWYAMQDAVTASPTAYMDVALERHADYILSHRPEDRDALAKIGTAVWQKNDFTLVKVNK